MSNETKRDVLERLIECYSEVSDAYTNETGSQYYCDDEPNYLDEYDAALPDDLPVIPELISKYLKMWKHDHGDLFQAFDEGTSASLDGTKWESVQDWFSDAKDSFDTFARAWVLGVWCVEETGEVVKL
ncbi:hypothetical protein [Lacticaseibacillus paracasei]|uniref:hypothetical protein n=1 Tax=Lacticaseibacillus paracasei TaxID=1597 RepID=UPI000920B52A|nr:hypothetical protein [Lacticaseibacillus paracasei]QXJ68202.1 hypothetical protein J5Y16_01070 [Lacticaseibacillus paracasei subsp. paracasei]GAV18673.1 hypothetical protein SILAB01_02573 [Lacticaseibacillus paracasei]